MVGQHTTGRAQEWSDGDVPIIIDLCLSSAYGGVDGKSEPSFTNLTDRFRGTLDYLFYSSTPPSGSSSSTTPPIDPPTSSSSSSSSSSSCLQCLSVEPLLSENEATSQVALPSIDWPSDHIALCARFNWM